MNSKSAKPETCQVAIFNEPNQTLEIRHEAIPVIANDELLVTTNCKVYLPTKSVVKFVTADVGLSIFAFVTPLPGGVAPGTRLH